MDTNPDTQYCYYSTFTLFDDPNILVRKQRFVKRLILLLGFTLLSSLIFYPIGEEWKTYASQAILIKIDNQINHMAWQFCFDNLLLTWFDRQNSGE